MKEIQRKDLVIGEVYSDIDSMGKDACFLEFIKRTDNSIFFKRVGKSFNYAENSDGFIEFYAEGSPFFKV